jgi:hypothetical protein
MASQPPKVFISYSHDSEPHKDWVLTLATRLVANGVNVVFDQWDLHLGSDIALFMESRLSEADRVLSICTNQYVKKADNGIGGVGYEKMILTAQIMRNVQAERIIPVIRDNDLEKLTPVFLASRRYIDFRDDLLYESRYGELVGEIHGYKIKPKPPLGKNPFLESPETTAPLISFGPERYVSPALAGKITFDYSNNNGRYVLGAGAMAFETAWSAGGNSAIYVYKDPPSIRSVALALGVSNIADIVDASIYDISSRSRMPQLGEIVVWRNTAGYYLATKVENLQSRIQGAPKDEIIFSYVIQPNKTASFAPVKTDV